MWVSEVASISDLKNVFLERFIPPRVYGRILSGKYNFSWWEWDPETLWLAIEDDFGAQVIDEVRDKINALRVINTTRDFWEDFSVFEKIIIAFNDRYVDVEHIQVCLPEELAYGLTVANSIVMHPFSREIKIYIQACCKQAGLLAYPRSLAFAQPRYEDEGLRDLVQRIRREWDIERFTLLTIPERLQHDPVMVQVGRLHDIEVYVQERLAKGEEIPA
jgi:hypothetical protein